MNIDELKSTLTETGNPFVWITEAGWFFNEQSGSVRYSAEQIMQADSFDAIPALEVKAEAVKETAEVISEKPKNKGGKK